MEKHEASKEIDLLEYWRIILARKKVLFAFAGSLIVLTGIFSFLATPIYRATATLLIEEEGSRLLSIEESFGSQSRYVQDLRFFNTQLKLFKSKSLAEKVARKMNLASRPEFASRVRRPVAGAGGPSAPAALVNSMAAEILRHLSVSPLRETKLLELSYESPSPSMSAEIVNTLAEEFITDSIERRYQTTQQASDFLSEQIASLREEPVGEGEGAPEIRPGKRPVLPHRYDQHDGQQVRRPQPGLQSGPHRPGQCRVRLPRDQGPGRGLHPPVRQQPRRPAAPDRLHADQDRLRREDQEVQTGLPGDGPAPGQARKHAEGPSAGPLQMAETDYQSALKKENSLKSLLEQQKIDVWPR